MKSGRYFIIFTLLCLAQALISNYFLFSQYVLISLLPLLILSLPPRCSTPAGLLTAFAAGFAVDFIGGTTLGLTGVALLPLALLRFPILRIVSGEEILSERNDTPLSHQSTNGFVLTMIIGCLLFFTVYVWVDAAGTRPVWFNLLRTLLSSVVSSVLCAILGDFIFIKNR